MLMLGRKEAESIVIGDEIEVRVMRITPDQIRLGIRAPRHISIHRKEVYERIQGAKRTGRTIGSGKPPHRP